MRDRPERSDPGRGHPFPAPRHPSAAAARAEQDRDENGVREIYHTASLPDTQNPNFRLLESDYIARDKAVIPVDRDDLTAHTHDASRASF